MENRSDLTARPLASRFCVAAAGLALAVAGSVAPAQAQPSAAGAARTVTDERGTHIVYESAPAPAAPGQPGTDEVRWQFFDPDSIASQVALSGAGGTAWAWQTLNNVRLQKFEIAGTGTPALEFQSERDPASGGVHAARDADLTAWIGNRGGEVFVFAFDSVNTEPLWTFAYPAGYTSAGGRGIHVSRGGEVVLAAAWNPGSQVGTLFVLDGATGEMIVTWDNPGGSIAGIDATDDGSLALLTQGTTARLIDTQTGAEVFTQAGSGVGGYYRISGDGSTIAIGGFSLLVMRRDGSTYSTAFTFAEANTWFGAGIAVSRDGSTVGVMSHNYATGYVDRMVRLWDVPSTALLGTYPVTGFGQLQGSVRGAEMSDDGEIFVGFSWGTQDRAYPEVVIFDREVNYLGGISTPGSVFHADITPDAKYILAGSKAVHANTFGRGGHVTLFELPDRGTPCYADCNGDNELTLDDFLCFMDEFAAGSPYADCNGDGQLTLDDFLCFMDEFAGGCP